MKPLYTEVFTLKISSTQKRTLEKLKSRNIKVSGKSKICDFRGKLMNFGKQLKFKVK